MENNKDLMVSFAELDVDSPEALSTYFEQNTCHAILNNATLPIRIYDPKDIEFTDAYAYAHENYFYLFKGSCLRDISKGPGIYFDPEKKEYYMVQVDESNQDEVEEFKICPEHMVNFDLKKIFEDLRNNHDTIYSSTKQTVKCSIPQITKNDDCLKRAAKTFLMEKGIDIDEYRDRFGDKNATFNFKQVIRGDNKLSILLFERGMDAFNLKYTITIEEADPNNVIGLPLKKPIVISSTDTYDL